MEAARIAKTRFGLPPLLIDQILYPSRHGWIECRNNVKLMRLVSLCQKQLLTRRTRRKRTFCTEVARRI